MKLLSVDHEQAPDTGGITLASPRAIELATLLVNLPKELELYKDQLIAIASRTLAAETASLADLAVSEKKSSNTRN